MESEKTAPWGGLWRCSCDSTKTNPFRLWQKTEETFLRSLDARTRSEREEAQPQQPWWGHARHGKPVHTHGVVTTKGEHTARTARGNGCLGHRRWGAQWWCRCGPRFGVCPQRLTPTQRAAGKAPPRSPAGASGVRGRVRVAAPGSAGHGDCEAPEPRPRRVGMMDKDRGADAHRGPNGEARRPRAAQKRRATTLCRGRCGPRQHRCALSRAGPGTAAARSRDAARQPPAARHGGPGALSATRRLAHGNQLKWDILCQICVCPNFKKSVLFRYKNH